MAALNAVVRRSPTPEPAVSSSPESMEARPIDGQSPALALQAQLAAEFAPAERRWSPRATMAFVLLTCGSFWILAAATGLALLRQ